MATNIIDLPKDTWTNILSNVRKKGSVYLLDIDPEPTSYLIALVPAGDPPPGENFKGGIKIEESFSPSNTENSDYYIKPTDFDGKVVVLT
jgi:hypothetical protein